MSEGWIAIHRELQHCWIADDKPYNYMSAWIDLLLLANHRSTKIPFDGKLLEIERGSFITSMLKLSDRWGWSRTKVKHFLDMLVEDKMIEYKSDNKKTSINVVNYRKYQDIDVDKKATEKQQKSNRKTTEKQQKSTNNNVNNEKQCKQYKYIGFCDEELDAVLKDFIEMRNKIKKPMTNRAIEMLIKKVKELSQALPFSDEEYNKATAKLIMEQSIEHSWSGVYPLKESDNKHGNRSDKEPPVGYKDESTGKIYLGDGKWDYDNSVWE